MDARGATRHHHLAVETSPGTAGAPDLVSAHSGNPQIIDTAPAVYVVFWGSQWGLPSTDAGNQPTLSGDPDGMAADLLGMLSGLGTGSEGWSGITTQYCTAPTGATQCATSARHVGVPTGGALAGWWADGSVSAPVVATSTQVATEAADAAAHFGFSSTNPPGAAGIQIVVVSPTGTHPEGFNLGSPTPTLPLAGACADHGWATAPAIGGYAFTDLPYLPDAGASCGAGAVHPGNPLDGVSIVEGHEYAETLTDTDPGAGWFDTNGQEVADRCVWTGLTDVAMATGTFPMQPIWSNDTDSCAISHPVVANAPPGGASLAATPATVTLPGPGSPATTTIATTALGGPDSLGLTVSAPPGIDATLGSTTVATGDQTTLSVVADATVVAGTYDVLVTAGMGSGSTMIDVPVTVTPGTFTVSLPSTTLTMTAGTVATTPIVTTTVSGAPQWLSLSLQSSMRATLPAHVHQTVTVGPVVSGQMSTQVFWSDPKAKAGSYSYTLRAISDSGVMEVVPFTLVVVASPKTAFTLSWPVDSGTISRGSGAMSAIVKTTRAGAPQPITLSVTGLVPGISAAVPTTVLSGSHISVLFSASFLIPPGWYFITVQAQEAGSPIVSSTFALLVT